MAKKGLGRGLGMLLGEDNEAEAALARSATDIARLPIEFIIPDPEQPRKHFADDAIAELAASIRTKGLLQPILVRPTGKNKDEYLIVAGERRWRAAQKAQLHEVPVIIRELDDEQAAEIALIENVQRVDLNPMEEAEAYQRLAEKHERGQAEIAEAVGKSRSHIANMMRLTGLPKKVKAQVREGHLSMGHARAILSAEYPEQVASLVLERGLSVRQTEALVRAAREGGVGIARKEPKASAPAEKNADTRALERDIAEALGMEISIEHRGKKGGTLTVSYGNLDQLDEICRRLMELPR
ncbi:ParB/RepB/Spo0J family partition protein [Aquisalinus flavus]|uniref:Chromosome partitioning protein ParB n=1 Tax=Aquisalinus flavus TaxID=1526572 RepID=A0A8J2V3N5_9PROT|nr:ParB/RepB/Spo0J family partition protein [Aquisalinus flavus]GGD14838.1 chromosome partitioning protein ParB [Aquisalinus flavus]